LYRRYKSPFYDPLKMDGIWLKFLNKGTNVKIAELAQKLLHLCETKNLKLVSAESCTGGSFAAALTQIPGASHVFIGSVVTYQDIAKSTLLNVPEALLLSEGAVSAPVATAMLQGLLVKFTASIGIAITGFAGPEGGTPNYPTGTIFLCIGDTHKLKKLIRLQLSGSRQLIIRKAVRIALRQLIHWIEDHTHSS